MTVEEFVRSTSWIVALDYLLAKPGEEIRAVVIEPEYKLVSIVYNKDEDTLRVGGKRLKQGLIRGNKTFLSLVNGEVLTIEEFIVG